LVSVAKEVKINIPILVFSVVFGCKRFRKGFFNFGFFGSIIPLIAPNRNSAFKEKSFWFRKMLMINVFGDKSC